MTRRFRPSAGSTVAMLVALATLISLGTWQALKIGPKTALINRIEAGLTAEPSTLPVHVDDPLAVAYRRFSFEGQLMDVEPVKVQAISVDGNGGFHLYAPVKTTFGRVVIVNFGWVPPTLQTFAPLLPYGQKIRLSGVLMVNARRGSFTPPNNVVDRTFYSADVFDLAQVWGLGAKDFYHFRLFSDHRGGPGVYPQGGQVRMNIPNDHFEYMLTWYGIALGLVGVYIAFSFRSVGK